MVGEQEMQPHNQWSGRTVEPPGEGGDCQAPDKNAGFQVREGQGGGRFPPAEVLSGPFHTTRDNTESSLSHLHQGDGSLPFKGCP